MDDGSVVALIVGAWLAVVVIISFFNVAVRAAWRRWLDRLNDRMANREHQQLLQAHRQMTQPFVEQHKETLLRKRRQLVVADDYGQPIRRNWDKEKRYFLTKIVFAGSDIELPPIGDELLPYIDELLDAHETTSPADTLSPLPSDPKAFEHFCADLLRSKGWTANVTPATGDQGADIVATRLGTTVVIQCKLYSSPVGNKAVQEVVAAQAMHGAQYGCVVSNQSYTNSAKVLASANGVLLLHHDDLVRLDERITTPPPHVDIQNSPPLTSPE